MKVYDGMPCPCGSLKPYEMCCAPCIGGEHPCADAQSLMRSRYCAYALGDEAYLMATTVPEKQVPEDAELIRAHAETTTWLGVEVLDANESGDTAVVTFKAFYKEYEGVPRVHHEMSSFRRMNGRWYYDKGHLYDSTIGRNDPCPCGSGKKFKKCCAAKP